MYRGAVGRDAPAHTNVCFLLIKQQEQIVRDKIYSELTFYV